MLSALLSRSWWVLLFRGAIAILFGIVAITSPGMTVASLVLYFAVFAFVDGVASVFQAVFGGQDETESRWVLLLEGLLGIAVGVITFQAPGITTLMLLLYIGFWAMASGLLRIIMAIRLRKEIEGEWWMILGGVVSILFGMSMLSRPGEGALAVLTVIGFWSIVSGVSLVFLSFRVKSLGGKLGAVKQRLTHA